MSPELPSFEAGPLNGAEGTKFDGLFVGGLYCTGTLRLPDVVVTSDGLVC